MCEDQEGVGHFQMTMRNAGDAAAAAAFLKPARKRRNLLFTGAQTEGVILEGNVPWHRVRAAASWSRRAPAARLSCRPAHLGSRIF